MWKHRGTFSAKYNPKNPAGPDGTNILLNVTMLNRSETVAVFICATLLFSATVCCRPIDEFASKPILTEEHPSPTTRTISPLKKKTAKNHQNSPAAIGRVPGSALTTREAQQVLQRHNMIRNIVGVRALAWSEHLARYAQGWANHLASTSCRLEHRPQSGNWAQQHGENLFMGTAGHYGVEDAVDAWESEKIHYRGRPLTSSSWYATAHYTQLVWQDTEQVGCGKAECDGNIIVVCNYEPAGNILGKSPF